MPNLNFMLQLVFIPEVYLFVCFIQKNFRSCHPELFLVKGVLKICSKFTGESPCRSMISIKLLCNFIEITLWYGCSPVNLLHIFRTPFTKNSSAWLLLNFGRFVKELNTFFKGLIWFSHKKT